MTVQRDRLLADVLLWDVSTLKCDYFFSRFLPTLLVFTNHRGWFDLCQQKEYCANIVRAKMKAVNCATMINNPLIEQSGRYKRSWDADCGQSFIIQTFTMWFLVTLSRTLFLFVCTVSQTLQHGHWSLSAVQPTIGKLILQFALPVFMPGIMGFAWWFFCSHIVITVTRVFRGFISRGTTQQLQPICSEVGWEQMVSSAR